MVMARRSFTVGCLAGLVLAGAGCAAETNFSQRPGFKEFFAANPPAGVANATEQALLRRHAPRFHLPAGHEGPIDFYRDYVAHGSLVTGDGARYNTLPQLKPLPAQILGSYWREGDEGGLATLPPQSAAQRRPGRVLPRAGAGVPPQPGLREAGDGGLHAAVMRRGTGDLPGEHVRARGGGRKAIRSPGPARPHGCGPRFARV